MIIEVGKTYIVTDEFCEDGITFKTPDNSFTVCDIDDQGNAWTMDALHFGDDSTPYDSEGVRPYGWCVGKHGFVEKINEQP